MSDNNMKNPILDKTQEQTIVVEDLLVIIKLIQASAQRGSIKANELKTVGNLYDKINFILNKLQNEQEQLKKEQEETKDGGLSKTNN